MPLHLQLVHSMGAIVLLVLLAGPWQQAAAGPQVGASSSSSVEEAKQRQEHLMGAMEDFLAGKKGDDLLNLHNTLAIEGPDHDSLVSFATTTHSPNSENVEHHEHEHHEHYNDDHEHKDDHDHDHDRKHERHVKPTSGVALGQPEVHEWSSEHVDPVTGAKSSASSITTTVVHGEHEEGARGSSSSLSRSRSSSRSTSSHSFQQSSSGISSSGGGGSSGGKAALATSAPIPHNSEPHHINENHLREQGRLNEQPSRGANVKPQTSHHERDPSDGRASGDAESNFVNEHLEHEGASDEHTSLLMEESDLFGPDEKVDESYIDHSDPHDPKQVRVEKDVKTRVGPNGYVHERREAKTSHSLGGGGRSSSSSTSSYLKHSSSSSSSGSGSGSGSGGIAGDSGHFRLDDDYDDWADYDGLHLNGKSHKSHKQNHKNEYNHNHYNQHQKQRRNKHPAESAFHSLAARRPLAPLPPLPHYYSAGYEASPLGAYQPAETMRPYGAPLTSASAWAGHSASGASAYAYPAPLAPTSNIFARPPSRDFGELELGSTQGHLQQTRLGKKLKKHLTKRKAKRALRNNPHFSDYDD